MPSSSRLNLAAFKDRIRLADDERRQREPTLRRLENVPAVILYTYGMRGGDLAQQLRVRGVRCLIFDNGETSRRRAVADGFELASSPDQDGLPLIVAAGQNQIEIMRSLERPAYYLAEAMYAMDLRNSHGPARACTDLVLHKQDALFSLYERLDPGSAEVFLQVLEYRASLNPNKLTGREPVGAMWTLPLEGLDITSFCDIGAYDGDSLRAMKTLYPGLRRSFTIEPNPRLEAPVAAVAADLGIDNTHFVGGAWDKDARLIALADIMGMLDIREDPEGPVQGKPLDMLLGDEVFDLIKMDVESAEPNVIAGGHKALKAAHCVAVAAYHRPHDILTLPAHMDAVRPDWKLAFAHYSQTYDDSIFYFWR
jgi:FkbM family methyltransferase